MSKYYEVFSLNIERVESLCAMYLQLQSDEKTHIRKDSYHTTDILRSSIVMLHSTFEEYFRCVLCEYLLLRGTTDALKGIAFMDDSGKHPEKITLTDLLKYKDMMVDNLIRDSIKKTLSVTSFNSYAEIASWAGRIRVDLSSFKSQGTVNSIISRRHRIVHEADNASQGDSFSLRPINADIVQGWIKTVQSLVLTIEEQLNEE